MGKRIVVIEDEGDLLMLIKTHLELRGFDVQCFLNGLDGLAEIRRLRPDLVLLDIKLPDISGMEIFARLRLDKGTEKIPVIFVTASTLVGDIEKAFRMGVDDYVCKPIELDELMKKVKRTLSLT